MLLKKLMFITGITLAGGISSYCQYQSPDTSNKHLITYYTFSGQDNIGKEFTTFSAFDLQGKKYETALLKEKITFINFWFEACRPCKAEFDTIK